MDVVQISNNTGKDVDFDTEYNTIEINKLVSNRTSELRPSTSLWRPLWT